MSLNDRLNETRIRFNAVERELYRSIHQSFDCDTLSMAKPSSTTGITTDLFFIADTLSAVMYLYDE